MRPAERLFLHYLRHSPDPDALPALTGRMDPREWERLYGLLLRTGLAGAFYRRMPRSSPPDFPAEFSSKLKSQVLVNMTRAGTTAGIARQLISGFAEAHIEAVPLKGPVLAQYLWDDFSLRRASFDLDFLVRREQYEDAASFLREEGFRDAVADPAAQQSHREWSNQAVFTAPGVERDRVVELHLSPFNSRVQEDFTPWLGRLRTVDFMGVPVSIFCDEDLVRYLCMLCMPDTEYIETRYLYDLHLLAARTGITWPRVFDPLPRGLQPYFALSLCRELFNTPVPDEALDRLKPSWPRRAFLGAWAGPAQVLKERDQYRGIGRLFFTSWQHLATGLMYRRDLFQALCLVGAKIVSRRKRQGKGPAGEVKLHWQPVQGTSMLPFLEGGDQLLVKEVPASQIRPGDVIVFVAGSEGTRVCHRVKKVVLAGGRRQFLPKGDNIHCPDQLIDESRVEGKVVSVCRNGRLLRPGFGRLTFLWIAIRSRLRKREKTG